MLSINLLDVDIWDNVLRPAAAKSAARFGVQMGDARQAFLDALDADAHVFRDLGQAIVAQIFQMLPDELLFELSRAGRALQLKDQALLNVPRADSSRLKTLNQFQCKLGFVFRATA